VKIQVFNFFGVIAATLFCSGCFPYHFTTRPGASGVVVDARTGVPVAGAPVSVALIRGNGQPTSATTATDGSFRVLPRRQWGLYLAPGDILPLYFALSVQREGYQQSVTQFVHRAMGEKPTIKFGELRIDSMTK